MKRRSPQAIEHNCTSRDFKDVYVPNWLSTGGEALMVFSIKSEIRAIYLDSEVYDSVTRNLQHAVAVSLDANYVYWSDIKDGDEAIFRSLEDGSEQEIIVTTGKLYIYMYIRT